MDTYLIFVDDIVADSNGDDELTEQNNQIEKIKSNKEGNQNQENIPENKKTSTDAITRSQVKETKSLYGQFISYIPTKNEIPRPTNPFFEENKGFYDLTYYYFSEKPAKFISQRVIELKKEISLFALNLINSVIIGDGINQYKLIYFDYKKFCTCLTKEFNEKYLNETLAELFIIFQSKIKDVDEDHNKKVIKYLRENRKKELFANEYLDKNFYELVEIFKKYELNNYLNKRKYELRLAYIEQNNNCKDGILIYNIDDRILAFEIIIRTLCIKFRDYSTSIEARKKRK